MAFINLGTGEITAIITLLAVLYLSALYLVITNESGLRCLLWMALILCVPLLGAGLAILKQHAGRVRSL